MEAAREADLPVVALDRPNPIGGIRLEGPVLRPELSSFVGRYPLPVRHGMTVGELARRFNETEGIGCDLRVVTMTGWRRDMEYEETGLPWVPPSPNMPTTRTALVYPGGCLIEGTNLSEGRGTTTPFELIGAPWLDARSLADTLRARRDPGVAFRAASFRPAFQKHAGLPCSGVQVLVTDPTSFRPFRTYLSLVAATRAEAPREFAWRSEEYEFVSDRPAIDLLLGRSDVREALEAGCGVDDLERMWGGDLSDFAASRESQLLYR